MEHFFEQLILTHGPYNDDVSDPHLYKTASMTKKVNDELEWIWREGHNSYLKYQPGICF
jgi:hypothetical protein